MYTILFLAVSILCRVYNGYILVKLWSWFIVPTFNLPALSIPVGIGISIVISLLTYQHIPSITDNSKSTRVKLVEATITSILLTTLFLLNGWVVTWFM